MSWELDVETDIYTYISTKVKTQLSSTYPDLTFTMDDTPPTNPKFPNVYIHFLPSMEQAETLDGTSVKAIQCTIQYEVVSTKTQGMTTCRRIASEIISALKELHFTNVSMANFENNSIDTKRMVGRARRTIASNDTMI